APAPPIPLDRPQHSPAGVPQPVGWARLQVSHDRAILNQGAEVDVGSLPSHRVEETLVIALRGQHCQLDPDAVRCQPADDPAVGDAEKWVRAPYRGINRPHVVPASVTALPAGPPPG